MDTKQMVLIGIVLTSFLTALAMSGVLPAIAIALIILIIGLIATYHIALNRKRGEEILRLRGLIKAGNKIWQNESIADMIGEICLQAQKMTGSEKTYLQLPLAKLNPVAEDMLLAGLERVNTIIVDSKKSLLINKDSDSKFTAHLPADIISLIGVPLKGQTEVIGVLYQMNKLDNTPFNEYDQYMLETIGDMVTLVLERILILQAENALHFSVIEALVNAIDGLNPIMAGHSQRVKEISMLIGQKLGLDKTEMQILEYSAILHDIGYLLPESAQDTKQHPVIGAQMITSAGILKEVKRAILHHHEHYNGSGYPEGLVRGDIPLAARIIAVADMYDAIIRLNPEGEKTVHSNAVGEKTVHSNAVGEKTVHSNAVGEKTVHNNAVAKIKKATGSIFDPLVVVALEEVEGEINALISVWEQKAKYSYPPTGGDSLRDKE